MKQKIIVVLFVFLGFQAHVHAGSLRASGTDETVSLNLSHNIVGPLNLDAGYIHNYENSSEMIDLGLHLNMGLGPVTARVGVKGYYTESDDRNAKGYAPGVGFSLSPIPMFSVGASYYYSDDSYSNDDDIERYRDWAVTANFRPLSLTNLFAGYGYKSVDMVGQDEVIMNEGPFVGVSLNF